MRTKLFLAGLVLASALGVAPSYADVIFSSFGPGNTFDTGVGGTIGGASSTAGFITQAVEFASPGDYAVGQIDVALGLASGTGDATVTLWTESGGLPDVKLGFWAVSGLGAFGSSSALVSITGITGINLTSGANYFLQIEAADDAWEAWNTNVIGATGTVLEDVGTGWTVTGNSPYAFDVLSADASPAPEPITLSMFGAGLLGLSAARRRKKTA